MRVRSLGSRLWLGVLLTMGSALAVPGPAAPQALAHWTPPKTLKWYWQLQGAVSILANMDATDMDGFDNSTSTVTSFHNAGQKAICYIDVGTWENWRPDAGKFPIALLGKTLTRYKNEQYLDIRPSGQYYGTLQTLIDARFAMCKSKGFDAIGPDNMDGYQNKTGFPITATDQLTYNEWVAQDVHKHGLAVFQKNDPDQTNTLQPYFDGAITEQCNQYGECSKFQSYLSAGMPVLDAEYKAHLYPGFCSTDKTAGIMGALFSTALDGSVFRPCWALS
jgi:hypothetical protein